MYKVFFDDLNSCTQFAEFDKDVEAVQLVLALHQTSNIPHSVYIEKEGNVIVSLEKVK